MQLYDIRCVHIHLWLFCGIFCKCIYIAWCLWSLHLIITIYVYRPLYRHNVKVFSALWFGLVNWEKITIEHKSVKQKWKLWMKIQNLKINYRHSLFICDRNHTTIDYKVISLWWLGNDYNFKMYPVKCDEKCQCSFSYLLRNIYIYIFLNW